MKRQHILLDVLFEDYNVLIVDRIALYREGCKGDIRVGQAFLQGSSEHGGC